MKLSKRVRKLERRVAELEASVQLAYSAPVQIDDPGFDPHELLDRCVERWMHGWDDDEDWTYRGYL